MMHRWRWTVAAWARAAALTAAITLAGCARPADIRVGASPDTPLPAVASPTGAAAAPSPTSAAAPAGGGPSLDYSTYYVCSATVKKPSLPSGDRQTVHVRSNLPSAQVTATAAYGTLKQAVTATTDTQGRVDVVFKTLQNIRTGTPVQVTIDVAPSTHCSTSFSIG